MLYCNETVVLTDEAIGSMIRKAADAYEKAAGKRAINRKKLELSVEEILLNFRSAFGTDVPCTLMVQKFLGKITLTFRQKGPQNNPVAKEGNSDVAVLILVNMDVLPKYTYDSRTGTNVVSLVAEQKPQRNRSAYQILGAAALAVLCYLIIRTLPDAVQTTVTESFVAPIFNKLTMVITAVATPLVFFAVINGIAEIGDINALGVIGKKYLTELLATYLVAGAAFSALAALAYGVSSDASEVGGGGLKATVQLVLDIVPDNLLYAFTIDNDLQVVVVAVFVGVALLGLQKKAEPIKEALITLGDLVNRMMTIVFKVIPAIVFMGLLNIFLSNMQGLEKLWVVFLVFILSSAVVVFYVAVRTCMRLKVPFTVLFKKQLATTVINLTTSSQVSALPENIVCCKEKFGISGKLVDFGLPLGIVVYMPCGACFLGLLTWSLADLAGLPISLFGLFLIMVMAIIVAIAAPPIPGSALTVFPIMLSVAEIPLDYYPVAIILGTVLGYFLPVLNGFCLQLEMVLIADKLDMIDRDALKEPAQD